MKKTLLILLMFSACKSSIAQDLNLYSMNPNPYTSFLHPAVTPTQKIYLAFPLSSSAGFQFYNNTFSYHDLFKRRSDDSINLDLDYVLSKMKGNNFIGIEFSTTLLGFGITIHENYFDFNINERFSFGFNYPGDLINLIDKGNGPYIGKPLQFSNLAFDVIHYREYSFGMSRNVTEKWRAGIHLKYLYGMENFSSSNKNLTFTTAVDDYTLRLNSDITINTSTPSNSDDGYDNLKIGHYLFGMKNKGFGVDLGSTYRLNEKFTFETSILDLGFIKWKENVKNYKTVQGNYTFSGIDIRQFVNDTANNVQSVIDSLGEAYKPQESTEPYSTSLHSKIYLSTTYKIREKTTANALLYFRFFNGIVRPAISLSARQQLGKILEANLSYSYLNRSFDNIGLGLRLRLGAYQLFSVTDNVLGLIKPLDHRTVGIRFGMSFNWGAL